MNKRSIGLMKGSMLLISLGVGGGRGGEMDNQMDNWIIAWIKGDEQ